MGIVRNQFSAEEPMSRNKITRNQYCTKVSVDTWKSASG